MLYVAGAGVKFLSCGLVPVQSWVFECQVQRAVKWNYREYTGRSGHRKRESESEVKCRSPLCAR